MPNNERRFTAPGFDGPDTEVINTREIQDRLPVAPRIVRNLGGEAAGQVIRRPNSMPKVTQADLDGRYPAPTQVDWAARMRDIGPKINTTAELTRNPDGSITRTDGASSYTYKSKLDHLNNKR